MWRFRLVLLAVTALLYSYFGWRLSGSDEIQARVVWLGLALCFFFILILPFYFWSRRRQEMSPGQKRVLTITQGCMAYINFLLPFVVIRDVVGTFVHFFAGDKTDFVFSNEANWILILAPLLMKFWGAWTIARGPQVVREELKDPRLPKEFDGFRILQISDLHISASLKPGFVDKVLARAQEVGADLIALTGDIVDGSPKEFQSEIQKLSGLWAQSGVMFVPGNHEYYWNFPSIRPSLEKAGLQVLINQGQSIKRGGSELWVGGVPDPAARQFGEEAPQFEKVAKNFIEPNQYRILLSHQPVLADAASATGVHFQLSGHTHAGQFFPWNLLIGFFQKYAKGFYKIGALNLYVNQGTGYWGPAFRVGTFCEMTEITLRS
jgi:uncharacterized protein